MEMDYNITFKFDSNVLIIGNAMSGKTTFGKHLAKTLDGACFVENINTDNYYEYILGNLTGKYVIIDDMFTHLTVEQRNAVLDIASKKDIIIINISTDSKDLLLFPYIIVINEYNVLMEGLKENVLNEDRILSHLGIELPFVYQLSRELKDYNCIDKACFSNKELVDLLWK